MGQGTDWLGLVGSGLGSLREGDMGAGAWPGEISPLRDWSELGHPGDSRDQGNIFYLLLKGPVDHKSPCREGHMRGHLRVERGTMACLRNRVCGAVFTVMKEVQGASTEAAKWEPQWRQWGREAKLDIRGSEQGGGYEGGDR